MKISNKMKVKQQDGSFEDVKISYIEPKYCTKEGSQNTLDKKIRVPSDYFNGYYSHVEGNYNKAMGIASHAEGGIALLTLSEGQPPRLNKTASPRTVIGQQGDEVTCVGNLAYGDASHAEGYKTSAIGNVSHSEGFRTIARGKNQHVQGKYNIEDTEEKYSHIVGNGSDDSNRSNAHTLDWDGNAWFAGDITTNIGIIPKVAKIWDIEESEWLIDSDGKEINRQEFTLPAGSISLGAGVLSQYDFILIKMYYEGAQGAQRCLIIPATAGNNYMQHIIIDEGSKIPGFRRRNFSTTDPLGVTFSDALTKPNHTTNQQTTVVNNSYFIPSEIYGIKL